MKLKLTSALDLLTEPVVDETCASLGDVLGDNDAEWQTINLRTCMHQIFTRLSSRVLVGKSLCRSERWLFIASNYYWMSLTAAAKLARYPSLVRRLASYFSSDCRTIRRMLQDAHALLDPEVEARRPELAASKTKSKISRRRRPKQQEGGSAPDAITWLLELGAEQDLEELDYVAAQLALTGAAYTPTDVTGQLLVHICEYPEVVDPLRNEIIRVIGEQGWSKASLYNLKLMDSFMRESQRHTPRQTSKYSHNVASSRLGPYS